MRKVDIKVFGSESIVLIIIIMIVIIEISNYLNHKDINNGNNNIFK